MAANRYAPLLAHLERPDTARRFVVVSSYRGAGVDGFYTFVRRHGFRKVTDEGYEQFKKFPILRRSADDSAIKVRMEVGLWEDSKLGENEDGDSDVIKILLISPMASTGVSLVVYERDPPTGARLCPIPGRSNRWRACALIRTRACPRRKGS